MEQNDNRSQEVRQGDLDDLNGEWLVRRDRLARDERLLRRSLDLLQEGVNADPTLMPTGEYMAWARRVVQHLGRWMADMESHLTEPVDAEAAEAARAEYESREAFKNALRAFRGGDL